LNLYKNLILLFGISILGFFIVAQGVKRITFSHSPLHMGQQLTQIRKEQLRLSRREAVSLTGLKNPFGLTEATRREFPPVSLAETVEPVPPLGAERLSMILLQEGRKMAIIDNQVVREGDWVNKKQVVRIEKERVLLRTAKNGERWAALSGEASGEPGQVEKSQGGKSSGEQRNN